MTDYKATSVAEMRAIFPTRPEPIRGEPTLLELLRILKFLMDCSQTHESSLSVCNLLFLCIPPELYATFTNTIFPLLPADPGVMPNYQGANDVAARATIKAQWSNLFMVFNEVKNMNKALTEEFIALVAPVYTEEFRQNRISDPNLSFRDVFASFLMLYGEADENDRKNNKDRMEKDWHPNDGIQTLINQISSGIEYAHFAGQAITDMEAVDIGIRVIMKCGLFTHDYELWQQQLDKSWLNFRTFWKGRAKLKKKTVRAGQLGFGMNAEEIADEESTRLFEQSVDQFGQAHAATQASIQSLTANNTSLTNNVATSVTQLQQQMNNIQAQIQAFAMASQTRPPAPPAAQQTQYQMPLQQYYPPPQYQQQPQNTPRNYNGGRGQGGRGTGRGGGGRGYGGRGGRGGYNGRGPARPQQQYQQQSFGQPGQQFSAPQNPNKRYESEDYCHSHGADCGHDSPNCGNPGPNHQYNATRYNAMGGSSKASHKTILPSGRILTPCVGCAPPRNTQNNNQQWNSYGGQYGF